MEAGQVLAADNPGKWKTAFRFANLIASLIWLTGEKAGKMFPVLDYLKHLARPHAEGGWLQPVFLWTAVALTVISGRNYLWSWRYLLRGK